MKTRVARIKNAHAAYWFLKNHPHFICPERVPIYSKKKADILREKGYVIKTFVHRNGSESYQREYRHTYQKAINKTLDIYYTTVDNKHIRNENEKLNVNIECWLEFGELKWHENYEHYMPIDYPKMETYHNVELDCGAPTFDDALIKLANIVLKKFGDYEGRGLLEQKYHSTPAEKLACADCNEFQNYEVGYSEKIKK